MTDQQIIEALIARNERVTQQFFFGNCRPLFLNIIRFVFSYEVDYDEFVSKFYLYLLENDAYRLKQFQGRSTIYQWMKVNAICYLIAKRDNILAEVLTAFLCYIECEKFILNKRKISFDDKQILDDTVYSKWKKDNGTLLYNIGHNMEKYGLSVARNFQCDLTDIIESLKRDDDVIAAVDGGDMLGNKYDEFIEDMIYGHNPNHAVTILN